ncbi:MAG: dinitrogenase iron-molybdenum cofactor biosynthesis protein [Lentisphaeria bacterium]|nr:dinitrogenase iron-molybdenum cofactor biosynthesis protein [Lentisphaeria bacterium]
MKIAVTCENHQVFQHFGHTPGFAIFEAETGKIVSEKLVSSGDSGHGALAALLAEEKVDVLICGGIGGGAINALKQAFILVVGGAEGDVREVAEAFLNNTLKLRENFRCSHHHHEEGHTCGDHGCGSGGCHH